MEYKYNPSFVRDVKKANPDTHEDLQEAIENIKSAENITEILNLKKLKGYKTAYRIKVKDHRLCFFYEDNLITIARFLPRKEVYRYFP